MINIIGVLFYFNLFLLFMDRLVVKCLFFKRSCATFSTHFLVFRVSYIFIENKIISITILIPTLFIDSNKPKFINIYHSLY